MSAPSAVRLREAALAFAKGAASEPAHDDPEDRAGQRRDRALRAAAVDYADTEYSANAGAGGRLMNYCRMTDRGLVNLVFRATAELQERVRREARAQGVDISSLLCEMVEQSTPPFQPGDLVLRELREGARPKYDWTKPARVVRCIKTRDGEWCVQLQHPDSTTPTEGIHISWLRRVTPVRKRKSTR